MEIEEKILSVYKKFHSGTITLKQAKEEVKNLYKFYNIKEGAVSTRKMPLFIEIEEEPYRTPYPVIFGDKEEEEFLKEWNREDVILTPDGERRLSGRIFWAEDWEQGKLLTTEGHENTNENTNEFIQNLLKQVEELKDKEEEENPVFLEKLKLLEEASLRRGNGKEETQRREVLKLLRKCYSDKLGIGEKTELDNERFGLAFLSGGRGEEYELLPQQLREANAPQRYIDVIESLIASKQLWNYHLPKTITERWVIDSYKKRLVKERRIQNFDCWEEVE